MIQDIDPYFEYSEKSLLSSDFLEPLSGIPSVTGSIDQEMILANCSSRVKENLNYLAGLRLNESNPKSGYLHDNETKEVTIHNIEVL